MIAAGCDRSRMRRWLPGVVVRQPEGSHVRESRRREAKNDHFLTRVLESPRIFVIGGNDELETMG